MAPGAGGPALAIAVTADAALTIAHALAFNLSRVRGLSDALLVLVSCLAPTLAGAILWNARALRARL